MEKKMKHLELVQGVINRMAHCSFLLKGWSVILVSGLFALAAKEANPMFVYIAYLPVLAFWILDGYYLCQERLYRKLYEAVLGKDDDAVDFSMDTSSYKGKGEATWPHSTVSTTMLFFHGILILAVVIVMIVLLVK